MRKEIPLILAFTFACSTTFGQFIISFGLPGTPTCSTPTIFNTVIEMSCGNSFLLDKGHTISGDTIIIELEDSGGMICLPSITFQNNAQNVGFLGGGSWTAILNLRKNGALIASQTITFTVIGGSAVIFEPAIKICPGDSAFIYGKWRNSLAVYKDTISGGLCDTILATFLSIYTDPGTSVIYELCDGDSVFLGGAWQNSDGTYFDTLASVSGCDSVVETSVTVLPLEVTTAVAKICDGDSVFVAGAWRKTTGVYTDKYKNTAGCDSNVNTFISVVTAIISSLEDTICEGDSVFVGGGWQHGSGQFYDTLSTVLGCDSIIETNLYLTSFMPSPIDTMPCEGDTVVFNGNMYTASTNITSTTTFNGCLFDFPINITFINCPTGIEESQFTFYSIFPNPASDHVTITFDDKFASAISIYDISGKLISKESVRSNTSSINIESLETGSYIIELEFEDNFQREKLIVY